MYCKTTASPADFIKAVKLLIAKPHIVNHRVCDAIEIYHEQFSKTDDLKNAISCLDLTDSALFTDTTLIGKLLKLQHISDVHDFKLVDIYINKLLPKKSNENCDYVIAVIDHTSYETFFISTNNVNNLQPHFPYSIAMSDGIIKLNTFCKVNDKSLLWLQNQVLPKIAKWAEKIIDKNETTLCSQSLRLVPIEKYYQKYNELKTKYGIDMVKVWPEKTDPAKFVYEDIAIATYLLILWEEERLHTGNQNKQSFVDLGCGNGLLVYILSKEGHPGYGIDVRKRGIWNMFTNVNLKVETIVPSQEFLFPKSDWLIGNHSDELTPWIPVMAAKSSYSCRFFLLPCCSYEFSGSKYQRVDSSKSLYRDYLEYILRICNVCGIYTQVDRLRIPSTKRICLIGQSRCYTVNDYEDNKCQIQEFINLRCNQNQTGEDEHCNAQLWASQFKPRESVEKVKNCTQLEKSIIDRVVDLVAKALLANSDNTEGNNTWNAGLSLELSSIASIIPQEILKELKSECGGLQTLLKNNHHIFEIKKGKVCLRYPRTIEEIKRCAEEKRLTKQIFIKQKPCWFNLNHPNGCPLKSNLCSYIH